jgi:hypothetical protein
MLGAKQTRFFQSAKDHISGVDRAASLRKRRQACAAACAGEVLPLCKVYASNIALNE